MWIALVINFLTIHPPRHCETHSTPSLRGDKVAEAIYSFVLDCHTDSANLLAKTIIILDSAIQSNPHPFSVIARITPPRHCETYPKRVIARITPPRHCEATKSPKQSILLFWIATKILRIFVAIQKNPKSKNPHQITQNIPNAPPHANQFYISTHKALPRHKNHPKITKIFPTHSGIFNIKKSKIRP